MDLKGGRGARGGDLNSQYTPWNILDGHKPPYYTFIRLFEFFTKILDKFAWFTWSAVDVESFSDLQFLWLVYSNISLVYYNNLSEIPWRAWISDQHKLVKTPEYLSTFVWYNHLLQMCGEGPLLAKMLDPGTCISNEGIFLKSYWMNI